jgi:nucleoside-diphosphate-sugar epimerase
MQPVTIVGCGYTGLKLARRWLEAGAEVRGFATRATSLHEIAAIGAQAVELDLDRPSAAGPPAARDFSDHLLYYGVPPPPEGGSDSRLERFLGGIEGAPRRIVYLSTTGVYGDRQEDTPPSPATDRAMRRMAAETALRRWSERRATPWCILRVAGIYGPGRLPLERLRRRDPAIAPPEDSPGNRIHVDDLVGACVAAGRSPRAAGRIYNVSDGSEDSQTAFLERVSRIAGLPPPPLITRAEAERVMTASAWSFLAESRRVDNTRMRTELEVALAYADLDAGIRASLTPD